MRDGETHDLSLACRRHLAHCVSVAVLKLLPLEPDGIIGGTHTLQAGRSWWEGLGGDLDSRAEAARADAVGSLDSHSVIE